MSEDEYDSLSPLDGRYGPAVRALRGFLSESALIRERIRVEIGWVFFLWRKAVFGLAEPTKEDERFLSSIVHDAHKNIPRVKKIEERIQHDVKAVEIFLRERFTQQGLGNIVELLHFACTSEDINNLAYALNMKAALSEVILPSIDELIGHLEKMSQKYAGDAMLARTHGQPATPTTLGKELLVFVYRLKRQRKNLEDVQFLGKFSGATGTFSAHCVAAPNYPWQEWAKEFVNSFGLIYNPITTQIEPHDWQCELLERVGHICRILHNLATDMWSYISFGYFQQGFISESVGSSTMPHKVNPIRFENAEANLEMACGIISCIVASLSTSRLQRDLSDSSVQRNIGVALGHSLVAIDNLKRGLAGIRLNKNRLTEDLNNNWEVIAEAVQTTIRAEILACKSNEANPYERLKDFTRNKKITKHTLDEFITNLDLSEHAKKRLLELTPSKYTGLAERMVQAHSSGAGGTKNSIGTGGTKNSSGAG